MLAYLSLLRLKATNSTICWFLKKKNDYNFVFGNLLRAFYIQRIYFIC